MIADILRNIGAIGNINAEDCGIAKSTAYTLIRAMNAELREMGKITRSGKVPRAFYEFKTYGGGQ